MHENIEADFLPINERHAIQEVIFAVQVAPDFDSEEVEEIKQENNQMQAFFPQVTDLPIVHFETPGTIDQAPPVSNRPVAFIRYKPNGEIDWELRLDTPHVIVRCLSYTKWNHIWKDTHGFLVDVFRVISKKPRSLISLALQYNNAFRWSGNKSNYDAQKVLNYQSSCVPRSLFDRGPIWHLHQGWFEKKGGNISGRILKRMHINSIKSDGEYWAKFENFSRLEFDNQVAIESFDQTLCEFQSLHDTSKATLRDFLSPQMQRRIELYAS